MQSNADSPVRCAIILAGGEGERLRPFIQQFTGDFIPKQYVNFVGTRSMLEHTFSRAEKLIPPERIFTVVSREHLRHPGVRRQLSGRPKGTVIAQPENKETGPGILLPLMHLAKRFPESTVAVFPSDHFIVEEDLLMAHVAHAFCVAELVPSILLLLGIEPDEPEPQYGYILPDGQDTDLGEWGIRQVQRFIEKPEPDTARELILQGALWNTMIMVSRTKTLLNLARRVAPRLYESFERILSAIGTPRERHVAAETYRQMERVNFSNGFLEVLQLQRPSCLRVLPIHGVSWSDWGLPRSIESFLKKIGSPTRIYSPDGTPENRLFELEV